jgi:Kef-type K+ transport system membrane component KefB/Trk K+ transport system NAD-binding subunit
MSLDVLALLLVMAAALGGGAVARKLGYPTILGELLAGIILGPPLLGLLSESDGLSVIGKLGVLLMMLYIGLHLDSSDIKDASRPAALASLGGFLVPAALGYWIMTVWGSEPLEAVFVALAMGVTSLATKSRILVDLGILNSRIAHVLMAGALFTDVGALVMFAAVLGIGAAGTIALSGIAQVAASAVAFLLGTWLIGRKVFPLIGRWLDRSNASSAIRFGTVVLAGLGFSAAADVAGLHAILGAFLAGLFLSKTTLGHDTHREAERKMHDVSISLLAPVFFVTAGFKVSFDVFVDDFWLVVAVIALATVGKIAGTMAFYAFSGNGWREGVAVGAGMNGRGAVEIIVAELALEQGLISPTTFSVLVFMAIATTATVPVLLKASVEWLRGRDELVETARNGVVVIGAGPVARDLAARFATHRPVVLVDANHEHCAEAEALGLSAVAGDALDDSVLVEAGIDEAKTLIAATANTEVNVLVARRATERHAVPQIHVVVGDSRHETFARLVAEAGASILFGRPVDIGVWDAALAEGRATALQIHVTDPETIAQTSRAATDSETGRTGLPMVVERKGKTLLYRDDLELADGDRIEGISRETTGLEREPSISEH